MPNGTEIKAERRGPSGENHGNSWRFHHPPERLRTPAYRNSTPFGV